MTDQTTSAFPRDAVLEAFQVKGEPSVLAGGQGQSVRVDEFVFKPVDCSVEAEWTANVLDTIKPASGFRVPRTLRTADGRSVVDGWCAAEYLPGEEGPVGHWEDVLKAGRAFHLALRAVPRPDFLGRRVHPWAVADRVAWDEHSVSVLPELALPMDTLLALRQPVERSSQLIHGDLTGNVLFAAGADPVVIDFSPYWRPARFAEAIVVVDGLLWFQAPPDLVSFGNDDPDWQQLLVRALIFRLVAHSESMRSTGHAREGEAEHYARTARVMARLVRSGG